MMHHTSVTLLLQGQDGNKGWVYERPNLLTLVFLRPAQQSRGSSPSDTMT